MATLGELLAASVCACTHLLFLRAINISCAGWMLNYHCAAAAAAAAAAVTCMMQGHPSLWPRPLEFRSAPDIQHSTNRCAVLLLSLLHQHC
jgi:hypothetical protein